MELNSPVTKKKISQLDQNITIIIYSKNYALTDLKKKCPFKESQKKQSVILILISREELRASKIVLDSEYLFVILRKKRLFTALRLFIQFQTFGSGIKIYKIQ